LQLEGLPPLVHHQVGPSILWGQRAGGRQAAYIHVRDRQKGLKIKIVALLILCKNPNFIRIEAKLSSQQEVLQSMLANFENQKIKAIANHGKKNSDLAVAIL